MKKLRLALAVLAVGLTSSASSGLAFTDESCPIAILAEPPYDTCGYTGKGSCAKKTCEYDCDGHKVVYEEACDDPEQ